MANKLEKYFNTRIKAVLIDLGILFLVWIFVLVLAISVFENDYEFIYYYNFSSSLFLSLFFCKDIFGGQSIGKRIYKLKVVDNRGKNLNSTKLILRNLFYYIAPVEFFMIVYNDNKRIGDIVIGSKLTRVNEATKINMHQIMKGVLTIIMMFVAHLIFAYFVLSLFEKF